MQLIRVITLFFVVSCSTNMDIDKFKNNNPELILEDYFSGKVEAWGLFHDRFGNLQRSFSVDIDGKKDGDTLVLNEKFLYDNLCKDLFLNDDEFDYDKIDYEMWE